LPEPPPAMALGPSQGAGAGGDASDGTDGSKGDGGGCSATVARPPHQGAGLALTLLAALAWLWARRRATRRP
jgi:MYXO-CTERM domain-containing protein